MERMLRNFWIFSALLMMSAPVAAESWESVIRKISHNKKSLNLTSSLQQYPSYKVTPKVIAFSGVVKLPSQISLINGSSKVHSTAGQIIIDNQIVCDYSPKSSKEKNFSLVGCSDGSRAGDDINVNQRIVLKLNQAASDEAAVSASLKIVRADSISYGLQFPFLTPNEGNILMFNDGAWVSADPSQIQGLKGDAGATGPQGPVGAQGSQGAKGEEGGAGVAGAAGAIGSQGVKGATGEPGLNGLKGEKGDAGVAGAAGAQGSQGPIGSPGVAGPIGSQGLKGDNGVAGANGALGPQGVAGPIGSQGFKGDNGVAGANGAQGSQGVAGPIGSQGLKGDNGVAGANGAQGPQGVAGPIGSQGLKGDNGVAGANGAQGPMGFPGVAGAQGPKGDIGEQGLPGVAGPQGATGAQGVAGPKGDKGDRGLSELAYLRDEKANGVSGGSCVANTWQTRSLNVLGGSSSFISLANNRFTLAPGKYFVEISAPAYGVNFSQAKLKVIETGLDVLVGSTASSFQNGASVSYSLIQGELIVTAASTFEIQQNCQTARTSNGLGVAGGFGLKEIYTQVKIIKTE